MDVSENSGTPKSSILIGFSIKKPSILGYPYFWKHPCIVIHLILFPDFIVLSPVPLRGRLQPRHSAFFAAQDQGELGVAGSKAWKSWTKITKMNINIYLSIVT